jgi:hypothetical protein
MSALIDLMDAWLRAKAYGTNIHDLNINEPNKTQMKINMQIEFNETETVKAMQVLAFIKSDAKAEIDENGNIQVETGKVQVRIYDGKPVKKKEKNGPLGDKFVFGTKTSVCQFKPCSKQYKATSNAQHYCSSECRQLDKGIITKQARVILPESTESKPSASFFRQKKEEEKKAAEEQRMLDSLREKPKINWKKAKNHPQTQSDNVNIL